MADIAAERGEIRIPRGQWVGLKRRLIESWNALLSRRFELARELYDHLMLHGKGKRGFDYAAAAREWADRKRRRILAGALRDSTQGEPSDAEAPSEAILLVLRPIPGERLKPRKVKKKTLPWARPASTRHFSNHKVLRWTAGVRLLDESCVLIWEVVGSPQAIDEAWKHPLGQVLEQSLASIHWMPNTGGTIVRSGERMDDATDVVASASSADPRRYGPLGIGPKGLKQ
jgi:hypothetical protein